MTPCSRRWECNDAIAGVDTSDVVADLGKPEEIGRLFTGFLKYVHQERAAA